MSAENDPELKQSQDAEEPKSEPEKIRVYGPEPDPNEELEQRRPSYDQPGEHGDGSTATVADYLFSW